MTGGSVEVLAGAIDGGRVACLAQRRERRRRRVGDRLLQRLVSTVDDLAESGGGLPLVRMILAVASVDRLHEGRGLMQGRPLDSAVTPRADARCCARSSTSRARASVVG